MKKGIELRTRRVKQNYRKFSDEKKKEILMRIHNRPAGQTLNDSIEGQGIANSVYYRWKDEMMKSGMVPMIFKSRPQEGRVNPRFSEEEKKDLINTIENLPVGTQKNDVFKKLGVNKGQYYSWRKKYGIVKVYNSKADVVPMNKPMNKPMMGSGIRMTTYMVTLTVEVGSLKELVGFCNDIVKTPKVKSVLSIE